MKEIIFNLVNGVHSGIPLCCNLFFAYRAHKGGPVAAQVHEERTGQSFDPLTTRTKANYVRCHRCYRKDRVKEIRYNGVIAKWLIM